MKVNIEIPKNWELKYLGDLGKVINGLTYSPDDIQENGVLVLRSSNVLNRSLAFEDNVYVNVGEGEYNPVFEDDILICVRNGSRNLIGKNALITKEAECMAFGAFMTVFRSPYNKFLFQVFDTDVYNNQVYRNLGATINSINGRDLKKFKVPFPPLSEQRKIAEILSTWDEAIAQTKALIEQLKLRNKGLAQQLLTGKKRLKGFSGEWKTYKFDELLKTVKRPVDWNDEALYKLISVRRRSGGIFYREALYGRQIKVKNLKTAKTGDFLFSKMQIVHGASALVTSDFDDAKISGSYISVRSKNSDLLNIEFLNWYSKLPVFYHQTYTSSYGVHIEKMTFDFKLFLRESINLPPLVEQTRIVTILKEADTELRIQEDKLGSLVQQKKGLMQKLLTGEVRVSLMNNH